MTDSKTTASGEVPDERPISAPRLPEAASPPAHQGETAGPGQTVVVAFSTPDEFLAEVRDRGPNVDGVLRLTFRWQPDGSGAPLNDLWVVATYLRRLDQGALAIVRLQHYVGGVWYGVADAESDCRRERAEQVRATIRTAAEALGIAVRAGTHAAGTHAAEAHAAEADVGGADVGGADVGGADVGAAPRCQEGEP